MRHLYLIMLSAFLYGCQHNGYKKFYNEYQNIKDVENPKVLAKGEEPKLYYSKNFRRDIEDLRSKYYVRLGYSAFNGALIDKKYAIAQAKLVGATVVLVDSSYTHTTKKTSNIYVPSRKRTLHTGTANEKTDYNSPYGYLGNSTTSTKYSGSSTTYGNKAIPVTKYTRRYEQLAAYLVKTNVKYKVGVGLKGLSPELRREHERNTGALIDVVFEGTPAFYANLFAGDILISINGSSVRNRDHAIDLMKAIDTEKIPLEFTIIRNNIEKSITIKF